MDAATLKFKTIQYINGIGYMSKGQVDSLKHSLCHVYGIEDSEENYKTIEEACRIYFELQNQTQYDNN